jgi:protein-L-isoaspartate(D-aspartate) O-methyltransferase
MKRLLTLALALLAGQALSADAWNLEAFKKAVAESGREMKLSQEQFDALQARKAKSVKAIEAYLNERLKKADPAVLAAYEALPREYYHYHYERKVSLARSAYEEGAKPFAIGYGSALSDYLGQAYMTQLLEVKPTHTVLEIGTGSGFQISWLSKLAKEVYSIEIQKPLGEAVGRIFAPLGLSNIHTRVGDGFFGWPEVAGGFDRIIVTCAASYVPPALLEQLNPGGIMVIPVGQPYKRGQVLYVYHKDADGKVRSKRTTSVYFVPMTGAIERSGKGTK